MAVLFLVVFGVVSPVIVLICPYAVAILGAIVLFFLPLEEQVERSDLVRYWSVTFMHWPASLLLRILSVLVVLFQLGNFANAQGERLVQDADAPRLAANHFTAVNRERFVQDAVTSGQILLEAVDKQRVVLEHVVSVHDAAWTRVRFGRVELPENQHGRAYLRLTSLEDGAVQIMTSEHLRQWQDQSAYFNGSDVLVELVVPSLVDGMASVSVAGIVVPDGDASSTAAVCGLEDLRVPTLHSAIARVMPIVCTAWLLDTCGKCLVTAGHCTNQNAMVVQFNVPNSSPMGSAVHPHPDHQYAVDLSRVSSTGPGMPGTEYGMIQVFPNSNTGLTPFEAQGSSLQLATSVPSIGDAVRVTGYGTVNPGMNVSLELNQTMRTHAGPVVLSSNGLITYQADTTGGNSGSPVIHLPTGKVVGLHTHGGCSVTAGNRGSSAQLTSWRNAILDPNGPCGCPLPTLKVDHQPSELVYPGHPNSVIARLLNPATNQPITSVQSFVLRYWVDRSAPVEKLMIRSGASWIGQLPNLQCGSVVWYQIQVTTQQGQSVLWPTYPIDRAWAAAGWQRLEHMSFDFETDPRWTVHTPSNAQGQWGIAKPTNEPARYVPASDYDGSGKCWLTGVEVGVDVSGGPVSFTTQSFNPKGASAVIFSYARYMANNLRDDFMDIDVQVGAGPWTRLERVGNDPVWHFISHPVRTAADSEQEFRVRYSVTDALDNSITEAAIDTVVVETIECSSACAADLNHDGIADYQDVSEFVSLIGTPWSRADLNADGFTDFTDYLILLDSLGQPCLPRGRRGIQPANTSSETNVVQVPWP